MYTEYVTLYFRSQIFNNFVYEIIVKFEMTYYILQLYVETFFFFLQPDHCY
jgi:hypothetical protein